MDNEKVVTIYCGKDIEWFQSEDGCGYWVASPWRIKQSQYLLVIRNLTRIGQPWVTQNRDYHHNEVYMVAKISGVEKDDNFSPSRQLIKISEYCIIPFGSGFTNVRNRLDHNKRAVVVYETTGHIKNSLGLDISSLTDWKEFDPREEEVSQERKEILVQDKNYEDGLLDIIEEAKEMVASALEIERERVTIKIEF